MAWAEVDDPPKLVKYRYERVIRLRERPFSRANNSGSSPFFDRALISAPCSLTAGVGTKELVTVLVLV